MRARHSIYITNLGVDMWQWMRRGSTRGSGLEIASESIVFTGFELH